MNKLFGNVIKVTPSSKVVGDMALFMLQNNYSAEQVTDVQQMRNVSFPESVKDFLNGGLGIPHVGYNKELVKAVFQLTDEQYQERKLQQLKLKDVNLDEIQDKVMKMRPYGNCVLDCLSYCLYEKVFTEFVRYEQQYDRLITQLGAGVFMHGMKIGQQLSLNNFL